MLDIPANRKKPNPTDIYVGQRIRLARNITKMSQEALASTLGITFQQVQKYEKGTNRVGASRLQHIAVTLGVPVSFFFEDAPGGAGNSIVSEANALMHHLLKPDVVELVRSFASIADATARAGLLSAVKAVAKHAHT